MISSITGLAAEWRRNVVRGQFGKAFEPLRRCRILELIAFDLSVRELPAKSLVLAKHLCQELIWRHRLGSSGELGSDGMTCLRVDRD